MAGLHLLPSLLPQLVNISNKVNLVLAGMYTGVNCCGVPMRGIGMASRVHVYFGPKKPRTTAQAELRASTFGFRGGYVVPCRLGRFDISN